MVQASKKNEVDLHKNELKDRRNEVLAKREPKEEASKKMTLIKRKPSLHITFHNSNSDETMSLYLTKVLGERLADEIRKGPCT